MNRLIPYSGEVYAYLLAGYRDGNQALQIAAVTGVIALLVAVVRSVPGAGRAAGLGLAGLWGWLGAGFYWGAYEPLNWAGGTFGWAALAQALLLAIWGGMAGRFEPGFTIPPLRLWTGIVILLASMIAGPLTRIFAGDAVTAAQAVGVTPIATIAATLSLLLLNRTLPPLWLLPVPAALLGWAGIRAHVLGVPQDMALLAVGGLGVVLLVALSLRSLSKRGAPP